MKSCLSMPTPAQNPAADPAFANGIDYGPLLDHIGYRLKRAYAYSIQTWDALFQDLGLAYGQYSVLLLISLNPGLSQLRLAEAVGLDGSTVVPITNRFVSLGWIRRLRRRDDRRTYSLRVTTAGQKVLDRARTILEAHEEDLVSPLTAQERMTLFQILSKMTDRKAGLRTKARN
jgi:DNA-binding MarR family transcriptional regulator